MKNIQNVVIAIAFVATVSGTAVSAGEPVLRIDTPMAPPVWAMLECEVLRAGSAAVEVFYDKFFDEHDYYEHVARWGCLDGPDDRRYLRDAPQPDDIPCPRGGRPCPRPFELVLHRVG